MTREGLRRSLEERYFDEVEEGDSHKSEESRKKSSRNAVEREETGLRVSHRKKGLFEDEDISQLSEAYKEERQRGGGGEEK